MTRRAALTYLALIFALVLLVAGWYLVSFRTVEPAPVFFNGSRAYADVQTQVSFGPRIPDSPGHAQIRAWMQKELESAGWSVEIQETQQLGHTLFNLIAKRTEEPPQIILGAHYDTRIFADHDPNPLKQREPVPGANDGASGVAVLLEIARSLPADTPPVWLAFFDAEDNGNIDGWDWILGSKAFVAENPIHPRAVVIVDMIGDKDLNIYQEKNSDPTLRTEIWNTAARLGYSDAFINREKFSMLDDHSPFLAVGIPAVDLIDFDYPYWHTAGDTPNKVSAQSLGIVGDTLWHWIADHSLQE